MHAWGVPMEDKVLCVDDDTRTLDLYRLMSEHLRQAGRRFVLETADDAVRALAMVSGGGPYAVVIADMYMPGMDGVKLLQRVKETSPDTVCIMLTGAGTLQTAVDALHQGSIFRFLTKPCGIELFDLAITAGIEQYRLVIAEQELLEKTLTGSIDALTEVLALVSPLAFGRASQARQLVRQLAEVLEAEDVWQLELAAMLSQLGCVTLPEAVLHRVYRGAELSPEEWQGFSAHPRVGHDLIAHIPRLQPVARAIAYQEKHYDGAGVPLDDTRGTAIPLGARLLKVALDFEAVTSKGLARSDALEQLKKRIGWYDPAVLEALAAVVADQPKMVLAEVGVAELTAKLEALLANPCAMQKRQARSLMGEVVLADHVWTTKDVLVLGKGHQITPALLERLKNYSRTATIREPIRVWMPVERRDQVA